MASKAFLLFLSLILRTVLISAHRPLVDDRYLAAKPFPSVRKVDGNGNSKVDNGGKNAIANLRNDRSKNDDIGRAIKPSSHSPLVDDRYQVSEPIPSVIEVDGNLGNNIGRAMKPSVGSVGAGGAVSIGVTPITIPVPGADGGFQFQLGPIGFGSNWNFGLVPPGAVIAYSQPIVVSPYSPPNPPSSPYAGASPGQQQPRMGYQQPPAQNFVPNPPGGWYSQSALPVWYSQSTILNSPEEKAQSSRQMRNPAAAPEHS